ncbi:MAG: YdcF family protein [Planctomycetes bacterium]|nr:YdcF family protein [Planctomycetota bacterium]
MLTVTARVWAGALAAFIAFNLIRALLTGMPDANRWWLDLRGAPEALRVTGLLALAAAAAWFAYAPAPSGPRRTATAAIFGVALAAVLWNGLRVVAFHAQGRLHDGPWLPMSFLFALVLGGMLWRIWAPGDLPPPRSAWASGLAALAAAVIGFPLVQMYCFGRTDYRRPADAVVVLGARAYADGRCSDALADRVLTGCRLYKEGLVAKLIFSGGPGDGTIHETEAMRRLALSTGIPDHAILLDAQGVDTRATAQRVRELARVHGFRRVLAVSHAYHLPRVKLAFADAGAEVFTVPAEERCTLAKLPILMAREVAAFWYYLLIPPAALG